MGRVAITSRIASLRTVPSRIILMVSREIEGSLLLLEEESRWDDSLHISSSSPLRKVAGRFPLWLISCKTTFATSTKEESVMFGMTMFASTNDSAAMNVISRLKNINVSIHRQASPRLAWEMVLTKKVLFIEPGDDVKTQTGSINACSQDAECMLWKFAC